MFNKIALILFLGFISSSALSAEVEIYLFSNIETANDKIMLGDISRINADIEKSKAVSSIIIDKKIYSDGFIDRSEIRNLVKDKINDRIFIYGNAVRIVQKIEEKAEEKSDQDIETKEKIIPISVKNGDRVELIVHKKGIIVQTDGTAIEDGRTGESIKIMLKGSKKLKGKVVRKGIIEINL